MSGYVVVLFGGPSPGWCSCNRCPLGSVKWFADRDKAREYCDSVPEGFEPHVLSVDDPVLTR